MSIHIQFKHPLRSAKADKPRPAGVPLGAKAADALAGLTLRRVIADLEDEIALQLRSIGELVYATHRGTPSSSDELQKILEYVDDLNDEIEGHEQQLKLLMGIIPCPVCGEDVAQDTVYCVKCGQPLPKMHDHTL